jgi:hypothetical protein
MMSERRFFGKCQRLATGAKGVSVACGEWSPFSKKFFWILQWVGNIVIDGPHQR